MSSNIIYVAGPMTGYDNFNRDAFNAKTGELTRKGYTVLNPAILPSGLTQAQYMDICLAMVRCSDTVHMLKGWEKSEGAVIEHNLAVKSEHIEVTYE